MNRRKKPFAFFLWHRRLGLAALALVFILSITGIMLNHTESLSLDETVVESDLILNWYGINPQGAPVNFKTNNNWVSQWNQQIFFNGNSLISHKHKMSGAIELEEVIAIALGTDVLLIDNAGEVIELMKNSSASAIKSIGLLEKKIALMDEVNNYYLSDTQFTQFTKVTKWEKQNSLSTTWSSVSTLTEPEINQLKQSYRGQGLNLERVILDLHSGRIFSDSWGIYIMDASAILMMLLGISGLWVWWSRKVKMRKKKHYKKHH